MKTINRIENEIKNLNMVKIENIDQFTDKYLGKDGVIPSLYMVIVSKEKGLNSSNCLKMLMELRQKFNEIVKEYKSKFD